MIRIIKRNGSAEALSEEKYNRVVMWATDGVDGVSASAVAMGAAASIVDGMTTSQVHDALIKAAADLISADSPNYSQVAARLSIFKIRKDAHGQYEYPDFYEHILKNVTRGVYDSEIMHKYSCEEIDELGAYMKPERDDNFGYAATTQLRGK